MGVKWGVKVGDKVEVKGGVKVGVFYLPFLTSFDNFRKLIYGLKIALDSVVDHVEGYEDNDNGKYLTEQADVEAL